MTLEDTCKLLLFVQAARPSFEPMLRDGVNLTAFAWQQILGEFDYETVKAAVIEYVQTTPGNFKVDPGDVFKRIVKQHRTDLHISGDDAWGLVVTAIQRHSRDAVNGLASLPPVVADAAKRCGWVTLCESFDYAARKLFLEQWEVVKETETREIRHERMLQPATTTAKALPAPAPASSFEQQWKARYLAQVVKPMSAPRPEHDSRAALQTQARQIAGNVVSLPQKRKPGAVAS